MAPPKRRERSVPGANGAQAANNATAVATNATNGNNNLTNGTSNISPSSSASSVSVESQKLNGHQQEQELFLQAFEKPTQIYRFLRNRHGTSPIFLNRTLSYMKDRMSRSHKNRAKFKVDSILGKFRTAVPQSESKKYLVLVLHGLHYTHQNGMRRRYNDGDAILVETSICRVIKNKRKDSTSDYQEILKTTANVVWNPHENTNELSTVSFPMETYLPNGDQHVIFKVIFVFKDISSLNKGKENSSNEAISVNRKSVFKVYGCDLCIYDNKTGYAQMGEYQAVLQELNPNSVKSFSPKKRSWENLPDNYIPLARKFDLFNTFPSLKFRLSWSTTPVSSIINRIDLNKLAPIAENSEQSNESNGKTNDLVSSNDNTSQINHNNNYIKAPCKAEKIQIVYNFVYSNNTRQQTEYTQEVICPWCGLDCLRLYGLLKHLKLCHPRFIFTYQPAGNGARIDVTINDTYDGSYAGSPYDLANPSGNKFARTCGPVRRPPVTNLLVCRPRRLKVCLAEFLVLDENELSNQRPYITGHNRLYHHTETCLPVHPKELDIDSEGESDPLWLRQKTIQMIDEFSDVNEGEKELMKLWNLHVMKYGFVGDCQLPLACDMFLEANGHEVIKKNLYRNFILHLSNLFDYGLVSSDTFYKTVQKLQEILSKYKEGQCMMSKQRETQLKYWSEVGIFKQEELKLKSPQKQSSAVSSTCNDDKPSTSRDILNSSQESLHNSGHNKRSSLKRSASYNNDNIKHANNSNKFPPKIAKKSATPVELMTVTSRSRRSEPTAKRNSTGSLSVSTESLSAASAKRRYSERDSNQQNASKRQRTDNTANGHVITNGHLTNTKTRSSAKQNEDLTTKKIVTRRRSVAGDALSQKNNTKTGTNIEKLKGSHAATAHSSMRTRHSLPTRR